MMKRMLSYLVMSCFVATLFAQTTAVKPTNGDGTKENPYQIENLANLLWLSESQDEWDKHFLQTENIDAAETQEWNSGEGFSPIGTSWSNRFSGTYNGDYHKIENLYIKREVSNQGLFGYVNDATIKKIQVVDVSIEGNSYVGGIVGQAENSTISQTSVTGSVIGYDYAGGICGIIYYGYVEESFSNASIKITGDYSSAGGIVGVNSESSIINNYSRSVVSDNDDYNARLGGIIGNNYYSNSIVENNYFAGTFVGESENKGGIIGNGSYPNIDNGNFWDSDISGVDVSVGNAEGKNTSEMQDYSTFIDAGWVFKLPNSKDPVWNIGNEKNSGYPYLSWEYSEDSGLNIQLKPIIEIVSANMISDTEAEVEIKVSYVGNPKATEFGIYYGFNEDLSVGGVKIASQDEIDEGTFTISIASLEIDKFYYVSAYSISESETVFSEAEFLVTIKEKKPDGNGVENDPYLILTFGELLWVSNNSDSWNKYFEQTADIDASASKGLNNGEGFSPIGTSWSESFSGSYNGSSYTIENLYIKRDDYSSFQGLFGYGNNATIKQIQLVDANIEGYNTVGGVVGYIKNSSISQVSVTGSVKGDSSVGGVIGFSENSTISQVLVTGSVKGLSTVGGVCGGIEHGIIEESFSNASIITTEDYSSVGGIVGDNNYATIINNYSRSVISDEDNYYTRMGGIIGNNSYSNCIVENNYFAGSLDAEEAYKGGIIGYGSHPNTDNNNFWDIDVSGIDVSIGNAVGKTTVEMQDYNTFVYAGWRLKLPNSLSPVWNIGNGRNSDYPYLSWQYPGDDAIDAEANAIIKMESISLVSQTSADVIVKVHYVGNPMITELGVYYGFDEDPSVEGTKLPTEEAINEGDFTLSISGLEQNKLYYIRAYAISVKGTILSDVETLITLKEQEPSGSGDITDPYLIDDLGELVWVSNNYNSWDKHFVQTANIDASITKVLNGGGGFIAIGNQSRNFTGNYDGDYHIIENLYIDTNYSNQGLFGYINGATIEKLQLENVYIKGYNKVGGIVGESTDGIISQTSVTGSIIGNSNVGGVCGYLRSGTVEESFTNGIVVSLNSYSETGGIVGANESGDVVNNYSTSVIDVADLVYAGGIIGRNYYSDCTVENNYFAGTFGYVSSYVGGIIGTGSTPNTYSGNLWDSELSDVTRDAANGEGLSTTKMQSVGTYKSAGWNLKFAEAVDPIWNIGNERNNGYPYLNWQHKDDAVISDYAPFITINSVEMNASDEIEVVINLEDSGLPVVSEIGVCYAFHNSPTIDDSKVSVSTNIETGEYTLTISNYDINKVYYFKAYATNNNTVYTSVIPFGVISEQEPSGVGSEEEPYLISTFGELLWVSNNSGSWDGYFRQTADIDAFVSEMLDNNMGFSPIGVSWWTPFTGSYDGDNHIIENLYINRPSNNYQGLFGVAENARIENIQLKNANIKGKDYVGGIVGEFDDGTISKVSVSGSIEGAETVGGICGRTNKVNIEKSFSNVSVHVKNLYTSVGGIVGYHNGGVIKNNYSISTVSVDSEGASSGGIIGLSGGAECQVVNNYFAGTFVGSNVNKGGIIGSQYAHSGEDAGNFWDSDVSGVSSSAGNAEAKTTAEMQDVSTFLNSSWSFKLPNANDYVWNIGNERNDGYPYLDWEYPGDAGLDIQADAIIKIVSSTIISKTEAEVVINVDYIGNPIATEFGVSYGLQEEVSSQDVKVASTAEGIIVGDFTIRIEDLEFNKLYYFRPYSVNNLGTAYGNASLFSLTFAETPSGYGEETDPYLISSFSELLWVSENSHSFDKHFKQTADIDASVSKGFNNGKGFKPIGESGWAAFEGSYDGDNHIIENLYINDPNIGYCGLFGYTQDATIENIQLENVNFQGDFYVGGIVGTANNTTISKTSVTGSLKGEKNVSGGIGGIGGIVGTNYYGTIKESFSNVTIDANSANSGDEIGAGGIVGVNNDGIVDNNYSISTISVNYAGSYSGGIVGYSEGAEYKNNYFAGTLVGPNSEQGGIIGSGDNPNIDSGNFWDSDLSGVSVTVGNGEGKTTLEMQDYITFLDAEWNLKFKNSTKAIWNISSEKNNGYPYLNWQHPEDAGLDILITALVKTVSAEMTSQSDAKVIISVDYIGNPMATEFGVCYGFDAEPEISDNTSPAGEQISEVDFTIEISNLEANKLYYVRAYATNEVGTFYGKSVPLVTVKEQQPSGSGEENDPYLISSFAELLWVSNNSDSWYKHFVQTENIDATLSELLNDGKGFSPIGNSSTNFEGTYNGGYYTIENLAINRPSSERIGLFGYIDEATIENLILTNVNIKGSKYVGGVVGQTYYSTVSQVSVSGLIKGHEYVGGIAGYAPYSTIEESSSDASINSSYNYVGGIVGDSYNGTIKNNYSTSILSTSYEYGSVGGIIGYSTDPKEIINNYFAGTFVGNSSNKGGIIGWGHNSEEGRGNFWDVDVSGVEDSYGNGEGKTTAQMQDYSTFLDEGWNFKMPNNTSYVWNIGNERNNGYPYLDWQYPNDNGLDIQIEAVVKTRSVKMTVETGAEVVIAVEYVGNPVASEFGVCYGLNEEPTTDDFKAFSEEQIDNDNFTISISNLEVNKLYYVRAYAINELGTVYGNVVSLVSVSEQEPSGDGEEETPYLISSFAELLWVSSNSDNWDKHFVQTDNIDATLSKHLNNGEGFAPIGSYEGVSFTGIYDGDYHTIENLTINRPSSDYVGLFGYISDNARIEKVILENADIEGDGYAGGIVGEVANNSIVSQTSATGSIKGYNNVGGVAGYITYSTIEESYSGANVSSNGSNIGGIVGYSFQGTIKNNYSTAIVSANYNYADAGGIIGNNYGTNSTVVNNYFAGTFDGTNWYNGGIIGDGNSPNTDNGNFWDGDVSGVYSTIGNGEAKTTLEMQTLSTFSDAGWVFKLKNAEKYGVWNIGNGRNNGYPYLNWQHFEDDGIDVDAEAVVTTVGAVMISQTDAEVVINVDYVGNPKATEFGICYGLNDEPTIGDTKEMSGEEIAESNFTISISNLEPNKQYYIRAYADSNLGTVYGNTVSLVSVKEQQPLGSGEEETPYLISTFAELLWVSTNSDSWSSHFKQTADIDASVSEFLNNGEGFSPIGKISESFTGSYDGDYHTIENLTIKRPNDYYQGLFGSINNATIKNLQLIDATIEGGNYVGGIVAYAYESMISKTSVTGSISGENYVGSIGGYITYGTIEESFSNAVIQTYNVTNAYAGGIVGYNYFGTIINNYSISTIYGDSGSSLGGIVGYNRSATSTVENNYFAGVFGGTSFDKGGIIGYGSAPNTESGNFWDSDVSGVTSNVGNGVAKSTLEMQTYDTFKDVNWDFKLKGSVTQRIWNIGNSRNNGYPYFDWQYPEDDGLDIEADAVVTTVSAVMTSDTDAKVTITIDYVGNPLATEVGVCYVSGRVPTVGDSKAVLTDAIAEGSYTLDIADLDADKSYYVRAYAINGGNTIYGDVISIEIVLEQKPSGSGTEVNPYLISSFEELIWVSNHPESWDKDFIQTENIDASKSQKLNDGEGFSPIGLSFYSHFSGSYDGNFKTIDNLTINRPNSDNQGLFGYVQNGSIKRVILNDVDIEGNNYVAGIAGDIETFSSISQTSVTGLISGRSNVAGICGSVSSSIVEESFSNAIITAKYYKYSSASYSGGIVGNLSIGELRNNYSNSTLEVNLISYSGGVVGYVHNNECVVENNYFVGTFSGLATQLGGIIGDGEVPNVDNGNLWDITVSDVSDNIGNGKSKTTAEMKEASTFVESGWIMKFPNVVDAKWNIGNGRNDGYPYLNWQYPNDDELNVEAKAVVKTVSTKNISSTEIEVAITVEYSGNLAATEFGVCYGLNENPTIGDSKELVNEQILEGDYTITISNLESNKVYYARAYAINSAGIAYGAIIPFVTIVEQQPSGVGTESDPYLISSFNELLWVSNNDDSWTKHFVQTRNIDASMSNLLNEGKGFSPIGNSIKIFTGSYDGGYHKIQNLAINRPLEGSISLFGYINNAIIQRVVLENVNIVGDSDVGGIIGSSNNSIVNQVSVSGVVKGGNWVGGICGALYDGAIMQTYSDVTVIGYGRIGGIAGSTYKGSIINNYSISTLPIDAYMVGGIVGQSDISSDFSVLFNYFAGVFTGVSGTNVGGIIGNTSVPETEFANFWDGDVSGVHTSIIGVELSTAEMKDINTFIDASWDLVSIGGEVWNIDSEINNGYPYLAWTLKDPISVSVNPNVVDERNNTIAIYPNPFNDVVSITGEAISRVRVYTTSGVQLIDVKYNNISETTIPTSDFGHGVYLFVIENNGNVETQKLIKR